MGKAEVSSEQDLVDYLSEVVEFELLRVAGKKSVERLGRVGLSQSGDCVRRLGYHLAGETPSLWGSRMVTTLDDGTEAHDRLRASIHAALSMSGEHFRLVDEELEVRLEVAVGFVIKGHVDGVIEKLCICAKHLQFPVRSVLEIKSASDFSFKKTMKEGPDFGYQAQATSYMAALGLRSTVFLFKNKSSGELRFFGFEFSPKTLENIEWRFKTLASTSDPTELPREYGPDQSGWLPFQCNYCPYITRCWDGFAPRLAKSSPRLFKLEKMDSLGE